MTPSFPRTDPLIPDDLLDRLIENGRTAEVRDGFDPFPVVKLFTPDAAATWLDAPDQQREDARPMMIMLIALAIVLVCGMALLAYRLATFALPFMLAIEAVRFAYATGAGWIGAGIVGFVAGVAAFGILAFLFATLRAPILRLAVAVVFAAPAAVAGYALVHGVTREAVPSEIWRQLFCITGGIFVGCSALARLADPSIFDQDR